MSNINLASSNQMPLTFPRTAKEMQQYRVAPRHLSLVAMVEDVHLAVWDDAEVGAEYQALCMAGFNEDSVCGMIRDDDVLAAEVLQRYSKKHGEYKLVASAKLSDVKSAMRKVHQKYCMSRKDRAAVFMAAGASSHEQHPAE